MYSVLIHLLLLLFNGFSEGTHGSILEVQLKFLLRLLLSVRIAGVACHGTENGKSVLLVMLHVRCRCETSGSHHIIIKVTLIIIHSSLLQIYIYTTSILLLLLWLLLLLLLLLRWFLLLICILLLSLLLIFALKFIRWGFFHLLFWNGWIILQIQFLILLAQLLLTQNLPFIRTIINTFILPLLAIYHLIYSHPLHLKPEPSSCSSISSHRSNILLIQRGKSWSHIQTT